MAKAGGGAAYQRLTVPQTEIGANSRAFGAISAANRRHSQSINQRNKELDDAKAEREKAAKQAQMNADQKRVSDAMAKIKTYDTKSPHLNERTAALIYGAVDELYKQQEILSNPNISYAERARAISKIDNIERLPENLKAATQSVTDKINEYNTLDKNGDRVYHRNEGFENTIDKGFIEGDAVFGLDENMMPVVAFRDNDGDGINDYVPFQSYIDQSAFPDFDRAYNYDNILSGFIEATGVNENSTDSGFMKTTTKSIDKDALLQSIDGSLINKDGSLNGKGRSVWEQRLGKEFSEYKGTEDDINELKMALYSDVERAKNLGKTQDFDWSNWRQNKKDQRDDEATSPYVAEFDNQLLRDDFLDKSLKEGVVEPNMIAIPDNTIKFKNLGGDKSKLNDGYITGFAKQKNGDIVVTGKALKSKGEKVGGNSGYSMSGSGSDYKVPDNYGKFIRKVSGAELGGFVKKAGFESVDDLRKQLDEINKPSEEEINNDPLGLLDN